MSHNAKELRTKDNPTVSVIVPAYNAEAYLEACLSSVRNQSYRDLEIIIVDDGSTDRTPVLCDTFAEQDSRVRVIHRANGGISAARNTGTSQSTGGYIVYVDSDDCIGPHHIEFLLKALVNTRALISTTGFQPVLEQKVEKTSYSANTTKKYDAEQAILSALKGEEVQFYAWGKMFDASLKDSVVFPEGRVYEDQALFYKLFDQAGFVVYEDADDYYYVKRPDSLSSQTRQTVSDSYLAFSEMLEYCMRKHPSLTGRINARKYAACAEAYSALMCADNPKQEEFYKLLKKQASEALANNYLSAAIKLVFLLSKGNKKVLDTALKCFDRLRPRSVRL